MISENILVFKRKDYEDHSSYICINEEWSDELDMLRLFLIEAWPASFLEALNDTDEYGLDTEMIETDWWGRKEVVITSSEYYFPDDQDELKMKFDHFKKND